MQTKLPRLFLSSALSLLATQASAFVVRAPLVGVSLPGPGQNPPASWFTETRVVNLGQSVATVAVTDVIGYGSPTRLKFTIPASGVADLPYWKFIDTNKDVKGQEFLALVEFTSDQPMAVYTAITTYTLTPAECPPRSTGIADVIVAFWGGGGCIPLTGPLVRGFGDYLAADTNYFIPWLVADDSFRINLYLVNPGAERISVQATFRQVTGEVIGHAAFTVDPHSMLIVPRAFQTAVILDTAAARNEDMRGAGEEPVGGPIYVEGAMTGVFRATGPFYVLAGVTNNINLGKDSINRFAMTQPETLP